MSSYLHFYPFKFSSQQKYRAERTMDLITVEKDSEESVVLLSGKSPSSTTSSTATCAEISATSNAVANNRIISSVGNNRISSGNNSSNRSTSSISSASSGTIHSYSKSDVGNPTCTVNNQNANSKSGVALNGCVASNDNICTSTNIEEADIQLQKKIALLEVQLLESEQAKAKVELALNNLLVTGHRPQQRDNCPTTLDVSTTAISDMRASFNTQVNSLNIELTTLRDKCNSLEGAIENIELQTQNKIEEVIALTECTILNIKLEKEKLEAIVESAQADIKAVSKYRLQVILTYLLFKFALDNIIGFSLVSHRLRNSRLYTQLDTKKQCGCKSRSSCLRTRLPNSKLVLLRVDLEKLS